MRNEKFLFVIAGLIGLFCYMHFASGAMPWEQAKTTLTPTDIAKMDAAAKTPPTQAELQAQPGQASSPPVGRYQISTGANGTAFLLDTATGNSWVWFTVPNSAGINAVLDKPDYTVEFRKFLFEVAEKHGLDSFWVPTKMFYSREDAAKHAASVGTSSMPWATIK